MKLNDHKKHAIRKWFVARGENTIDLLVASSMDNCEICAPENADWWTANGFSPEEREAICAVICPPQDGDAPPTD